MITGGRIEQYRRVEAGRSTVVAAVRGKLKQHAGLADPLVVVLDLRPPITEEYEPPPPHAQPPLVLADRGAMSLITVPFTPATVRFAQAGISATFG